MSTVTVYFIEKAKLPMDNDFVVLNDVTFIIIFCSYFCTAFAALLCYP